MYKKNHNQGFTLIEVLLVIGIISILASIVIVAINPTRQLAQARNTQRWGNVNAILNGVHQYAIDNKGVMPISITADTAEICATGVASSTCASNALINLSVLTNNETYITAIPKDPSGPVLNDNGTGYFIKKSANGRITVSAPNAGNEVVSEEISVSR